jgi:hypothetical protein
MGLRRLDPAAMIAAGSMLRSSLPDRPTAMAKLALAPPRRIAGAALCG